MKQSIRMTLASAVVTLGLVGSVAAPVGAINVFEGCRGNASTEVCQARGDTANNLTRDVISTLLFILSIIAVIMIIIGGIKYVTSNGDASNIKSAKDTVLYSVVGLVVALVAYAIVNFVIRRF